MNGNTQGSGYNESYLKEEPTIKDIREDGVAFSLLLSPLRASRCIFKKNKTFS